MRLPLIATLLLAACAQDANYMGDPWMRPATGLSPMVDNKRRGQVELVVKSNYETIKNDIRAGGGPVLTKAMDAAAIPERDRPARILQLQSDMGLHANNPGALVIALMVYGS